MKTVYKITNRLAYKIEQVNTEVYSKSEGKWIKDTYMLVKYDPKLKSITREILLYGASKQDIYDALGKELDIQYAIAEQTFRGCIQAKQDLQRQIVQEGTKKGRKE